MSEVERFSEIWVVDTEYGSIPGEPPSPRCLVACEFRSRTMKRLWDEEMRAKPPAFLSNADALVVAFFAPAELGVFLALGWPMPPHVLDLFAEFRTMTNGLILPRGNSLLGALAFFGLSAMNAIEKDHMRDLALRGGPYSSDERRALLDYCADDVFATTRLLERMLPAVDLDRALRRGQYMKAVAAMEARGIPVDLGTYQRLQTSLVEIRERAVRAIVGDDTPFDGEHLRARNLSRWLCRHRVPWPRSECGRLRLDEGTFIRMSQAYPVVRPVAEARRVLAQIRPTDLSIGADGRNRTMLSPFRSVTGRNQPRSSRFVLGCPRWMRALVRVPEGQGLAYLDYEQQEFGIAAALSGDSAMLDAYHSGDPYLAFAKQARGVPTDATKVTHAAARDIYKQCSLGVLFGMGAETLATRIGKSTSVALMLLAQHRQSYPQFWRWSQSVVDTGRLNGRLRTVLAWSVNVNEGMSEPKLRNFPMQANGAEMLRVACCFAMEAGVALCAPLHDAVLIEATDVDLDQAVAAMCDAMSDASIALLGGLRLRVEWKTVRSRERLEDAHPTWLLVERLLAQTSSAFPPEPSAPTRTRSVSSGVSK